MHQETLRILQSGAGHPHLNMALDEALLHSVDSPPTLRFYRWRPAGLSLGYFQSFGRIPEVAQEHVVVRRITGGGAIFHDDEITFSLAIDGGLLPPDVPVSYDLIHGAIAAALADHGIPAAPRGPRATGDDGEASCDASPRPHSFWCFASTSCEDLVTPDGAKIVGSAQRRIHAGVERVLHHGSLVLTARDPNSFCGSVAATVDPRTVEVALQESIGARIAEALQLQPRAGTPTLAELQHAEELSKTRYRAETFLRRR